MTHARKSPFAYAAGFRRGGNRIFYCAAGLKDLGHSLGARGKSRWLNARNMVVMTYRSETLLGGAVIAVLG